VTLNPKPWVTRVTRSRATAARLATLRDDDDDDDARGEIDATHARGAHEHYWSSNAREPWAIGSSRRARRGRARARARRPDGAYRF